MRTTLVSSLLVLAAAAPALADNVPRLDVSALPASCRWTGVPEAHGQPAPQRLAAITSAASCMAIVHLRDLGIEPTRAGAGAVASAIAPSLALLDSVIRSDDLEARLIAQQSKADLLSGAAVKLASSAYPVGTMTGNDLTTYEDRVDRANALAAPFRDRSAIAFQELASMARTPGAQRLAATNPVVASAVSDVRIAPSQVSRR